MKKALLLFALLYTINGAFGQTKPTKDEIIAWIAGKINAQGVDRQYVYLKNFTGKFFYQYYGDAGDTGFSMSDSDGTNGFPKNQAIYFNNICGAVKHNSIAYDEYNHEYRNIESDKPYISVKLKRPITRAYNDDSGKQLVDHIRLYMDWSLEANLLERMTNALNDLGAYNCPPVKEVY